MKIGYYIISTQEPKKNLESAGLIRKCEIYLCQGNENKTWKLLNRKGQQNDMSKPFLNMKILNMMIYALHAEKKAGLDIFTMETNPEKS